MGKQFAAGAIVIVLLGANLSPAIAGDVFMHPGVLLSKGDLSRLASGGITDLERQTLETIERDPRSSADYKPSPRKVVIIQQGGGMRNWTPDKRSFKDDAQAAFLNAVMWTKNHDEKNRDTAIKILLGWAKTFEGFVVISGTQKQPFLEASWLLPFFINAAEIIKSGDNNSIVWSEKDDQIFRQFVYKLSGYSEQALSHKSNWGATASLALMAAGVFNDDRKLYEKGYANAKWLLSEVIRPDGEIRELKNRDCNHPQYSLTAFVQAAEIAANQGDDSLWLYSTDGGVPLLARALEYISEAISDGKGVRDCRNRTIQPGYGLIADRQYERLSIPIPNFEALSRRSPPDGASWQFVGWSAIAGDPRR